MTENDIHDFDEHDDLDFDLDDEPGDQASFQDAWQGNPLLKVGAVVLVGAVVVGAYLTLTKPDPVAETQSVVRGVDTKGVVSTPGVAVLDEAYADAVKKRNVQRAEKATKTGASALPTPVSTKEDEGLDLPQLQAKSVDPLSEWKKSIAQKRSKVKKRVVVDDIIGPRPELVPLIQPTQPLRRQQKVSAVKVEDVNGLAAQMRTIISSQAPSPSATIAVTSRPSSYTVQLEQQRQAESNFANGGSFDTGGSFAANNAQTVASGGGRSRRGFEQARVLISAGQIAYGQLLMELNSDVPGPVLATVLSGPLSGGRAIGSMGLQGEFLVINFNRIVKDNVTYSVNAIALDEKTTLPATRSKINRRYFSRLVLPLAAEFVAGYAGALAQTAVETTAIDGNVISDVDKPDAKESIFRGLQSTAQQTAQFISSEIKGPVITMKKGATMGILFMDTVRTTSAN